MPGPISDSIDPEFGTGANAGDINDALTRVCDRLSQFLGERKHIVQVVHGKAGPLRAVAFSEREWRLIRFGLERARETV